MRLYDIQTFIVDWMGFINVIVFILLLLGLIQSEPKYFVQGIFIFKLLISFFLIYRFNRFRKNIKFTDLDRRICFSAGINLLLISFADLVQKYILKIKTYLHPYIIQITNLFKYNLNII